jgi:hypothetical protein
MNTSTRPNLALRCAALGGVLAHALTMPFLDVLRLAPASVADVTDRYMNLFVPAGWAFAIWGLITGIVSVLMVAWSLVRRTPTHTVGGRRVAYARR